MQLLKFLHFPKGCYQARLVVRNKAEATESEDIVNKHVTAVLCLLAAAAVYLQAGTFPTPELLTLLEERFYDHLYSHGY